VHTLYAFRSNGDLCCGAAQSGRVQNYDVHRQYAHVYTTMRAIPTLPRLWVRVEVSTGCWAFTEWDHTLRYVKENRVRGYHYITYAGECTASRNSSASPPTRGAQHKHYHHGVAHDSAVDNAVPANGPHIS
jgi:hypothetical protein